MKNQNQAEYDPFEVRLRMMRSGITMVKLARRHRVSKPTATRAFKNRTPKQRELLGKFVNSLNVMDAKSMANASATLRNIDNSEFEK